MSEGQVTQQSKVSRMNQLLEDVYQVMQRNRNRAQAIHDELLGAQPTAEKDAEEKAGSTGLLEITNSKLETFLYLTTDTERNLIAIDRAISSKQDK